MGFFEMMLPGRIPYRFTHRGWMLACPIYLNPKTHDVVERRLIPEWWFYANLGVFMATQEVRSLLGLSLKSFPIRVTGEISGRGGK